ncbi:MAG: hypothetical protein HUJ25_12790 [Crocinitomicaceae bacterium]|nr:hypothetical protein [Crocinitomicaceae bacterium]
MRSFILLIAVLAVSSVYSQSDTLDPVDKPAMGDVHFLVDVDNGYFEIVIDDTMYLKLYKCQLPPGHHTAKIWSPGYVTNLVEFDVYKDSLTRKYVKMVISNERQQFESDYKEYRMKFHKSLTVPLSLTLASALTSGAFMINSYTTRKKVFQDIDLYFSAPSYQEAVLHKANMEEHNAKYNRQRIIFYSTLGLTAAALGTTIYTYRQFKKNNSEPEFYAPSPFKDKFSWYATPLSCGIKWRFG